MPLPAATWDSRRDSLVREHRLFFASLGVGLLRVTCCITCTHMGTLYVHIYVTGSISMYMWW